MKILFWLTVCFFLNACSSIEVKEQSTIPVFDTHLHLFDTNRQEGLQWPAKDETFLYRPTMPEHFMPIARENNVQKVKYHHV